MLAAKISKIFRTLIWLGLLGAVSSSQQLMNRALQVNVSEPTSLSYQKLDQVAAAWIDIGVIPAGTTRLNLPSEDLLVTFRREHAFSSDVFTRQVKIGDTYLQLRPEDFHGEPKWGRIGTFISAIVLLIMLLTGRLSWKFIQTGLAKGMEQEPLIRPDGKIPKRKVGAYHLTAILGTGGMGVVYQAQDETGHQVAIKVPAPHLVSQSDFYRRFLQEIQLGLDLKHPRVVKVLEMPLGEELYIVMEYVEGSPLDKIALQPWSLEWRRCLTWAQQALEALKYVHSQGIIHRDLKPANLMVLKDNSIKLMDFGIAHKIHGTRLTGTDAILGTPVYMAPEQLSSSKVDVRADLFSLGLILYERLKPGLPYSDDFLETLRQKLTQSLPPLRESNPNFPDAFDTFIMTLLSLDPEGRYADAEAALKALQPLLTCCQRQ